MDGSDGCITVRTMYKFGQHIIKETRNTQCAVIYIIRF